MFHKKEKEAREYMRFLHTVYIICYTIFYLYMLNHHGISLKTNPYSRHNPIANRICVSPVATMFEQEENCFKEDFVK